MMPRLTHAGKTVQWVAWRIGKIDSVGRIDVLANTQKRCLVVVMQIFLLQLLVPWNSSHLSNVLQ